MPEALAILGASGHGKVVADAAEQSGWGSIVFFDDAWPTITVNGCWNVVGTTADLLLALSKYDGVIVAIGNNAIRARKIVELSASGAELAKVVHPHASVSKHATLGAGSVVFAGAVINVGTICGIGTIINTGATIDHDCQLGDFVHVSPNASLAGGVIVGSSAWIGMSACVRQMISIGDDSIVGAGACVIANVPAGRCVMGVPACEKTNKHKV